LTQEEIDCFVEVKNSKNTQLVIKSALPTLRALYGEKEKNFWQGHKI